MLDGLDAISWGELDHAYGKALDVPGQIRALASPDPEQRVSALRSLYGNIYHQGDRFAATAPAIPFLLELALDEHVPERSTILLLVTRLVAGDWTVRNGQTLHDGERALFFGRPVPEERASDEGPMIWKACYEAAAPFVPRLLGELRSTDPRARRAASWLLGCFRPRARDIAAGLSTLLETEKYLDARAVALFSLSQLDGPSCDARAALDALLPKLSGWDRVMAALCIADRARASTSAEVATALLDGLWWTIQDPGSAEFYSGCPFGDDLGGDLGHVVGRMAHERARHFVWPLGERLALPVSPLASIGLTHGMLRAGFAQPFSGGSLGDRERVALSALYYCEVVWKVTNSFDAFRGLGLPTSRGAVGELLGLEPGDRDKGAAAFDDAAARTKEQGLPAALPLFEEALRLRPDMPAAWANTASALREVGRPDEAIQLLRRAIEAFGYFKRFYEELTLTLLLEGQDEAAVATATAWLDVKPDALLLYNRGCGHARLGRAAQAVSDFAQAVSLDQSFLADLAGDADLDPLRGRADFQALLGAGRA